MEFILRNFATYYVVQTIVKQGTDENFVNDLDPIAHSKTAIR